jgi:hypothetical protein
MGCPRWSAATYGRRSGPCRPLATSARLGMRGQLRLGRWLPFQAEQVVAPHHGFYWAARVAGLINGFDRYLDGQGELRWKLLGVVPVTQAEGPNVARSAVGRAAGEAMWLPPALLPRLGSSGRQPTTGTSWLASVWMGLSWTCTTSWRTTAGSVRWSLTGGVILTAAGPGGCTHSAAR